METDHICGYRGKGVERWEICKCGQKYKLPVIIQINSGDVIYSMMTIINTVFSINTNTNINTILSLYI